MGVWREAAAPGTMGGCPMSIFDMIAVVAIYSISLIPAYFGAPQGYFVTSLVAGVSMFVLTFMVLVLTLRGCLWASTPVSAAVYIITFIPAYFGMKEEREDFLYIAAGSAAVYILLMLLIGSLARTRRKSNCDAGPDEYQDEVKEE